MAIKSSLPASGTPVAPGETITYTLMLDVSDGPTTAPAQLTDTLDANLTFDAVISNTGGFTVGSTGNVVTFDLPTGIADGVYEVQYTATIHPDATGSISNVVVVTGGGGDTNTDCSPCSTGHPSVSSPPLYAIPSLSTVGLLLLIGLLGAAAGRRLRGSTGRF